MTGHDPTAGPTPARIVPASDESFLVHCGETLTADVTRRVRAVTEALLAERPPWFRNCHPAYLGILVEFDSLRVAASAVEQHLGRLAATAVEAPPHTAVRHRIPVCYDAAFGPDLADVAAHHGVSAAHVIERHTTPDYAVHFLGFCPGFAYLGGLDPGLATPRLATARLRVPAGSVGIGGAQTGVYPVASPGGWRLIGRTPIRLFEPGAALPVRLAIGDTVRFRPISRAEFENWPGTDAAPRRDT